MSLKAWWEKFTTIPEEPSQLLPVVVPDMAPVQLVEDDMDEYIPEVPEPESVNLKDCQSFVSLSKYFDVLNNKEVIDIDTEFERFGSIEYTFKFADKLYIEFHISHGYTMKFLSHIEVGTLGIPSNHQFDLFGDDFGVEHTKISSDYTYVNNDNYDKVEVERLHQLVQKIIRCHNLKREQERQDKIKV